MNNSMTTTRRALVLIALVAGVLFASGAAAQASYSDTAKITATPMSLATGTVQAPTQIEAKGTCTTTVDPLTGVATTTVTVKVEWWRSPSPGVTGYRVTAHLNDGSASVMATTDASGDEVFSSAPQSYLLYQPRFTITTLTSYGWTAQSALSNVLTC